ncbi:DUF4240 domain-containing protein [Rhizocola hellebori]|nr:DUF4240 domain-containing protein [Rhizocola hellebori]
MEDDGFWLYIEHLRARAEGVIPLMRVLLRRHVVEMGDRELAGFADSYTAMRDQANCWPLVEAVTVAFGYCSDDTFSDVQDWLICQGEQVYQRVVANPDLLVEFVDPARENAFGEAELFGWPIQEELGNRPEAAKLVEYQGNRALPYGVRSDLGDAESVQARYPRCAAAREQYLNSHLPSIALPEPEHSLANPTRKLTLGATWHSRRQ